MEEKKKRKATRWERFRSRNPKRKKVKLLRPRLGDFVPMHARRAREGHAVANLKCSEAAEWVCQSRKFVLEEKDVFLFQSGLECRLVMQRSRQAMSGWLGL